MDQNSFLENDYIKIWFDHETYMPNKVYFKERDLEMDFDVKMMRYPTSKSDSGAYIFAPRTKAKHVKTRVSSAFIFKSDDNHPGNFQEKVMIFLQSSY